MIFRSMKKDKRGVFGLEATKSTFLLLLSLSLVAYIIVVIMGTLQNASILTEGSLAKNQTDNILSNVSTGVTGFFSSINPVYSILAILVIILVLVVLVRVVQSREGSPQL